ncbi:vWA domain-containing protein [Ketogulonicigenium vulgare]|uniref:von Willebrand factor, type A n=1 Tax=Ketogulonicigenium vulgare (strain WSH-001) TaxID=759362 RepID=F9Y739_KETVW|nr:vWA domain-containing protein [Ketogulonicigenium vulgare]ADO41232.1 von Willebrand factor, type A [Ketogulonicigenium vulgare Y25]AEM42229.1 von Willebrand factor, type A [Ketogulonicigenium vulgare WSH-001]ALJ79850.1 hypothetical protein KVH_00770 [Ketogulonicigenium vulgare]ANW32757.1 hypothetical protein KvSKV_00780 [Ketogulonicigenium vulgare]AOZ53062.1 von Willebrand factor A [Ketogulonicigenium vulgare]
MSFLHPLALLLSIPAIAITLLHGRRQRRVTVSGLGLWQALAGTQQAVSPARVWPRPSWALFWQIVALLALVLALARPFWGQVAGDQHWLVIADDSALTARDDLAGALARLDHAIPAGRQVSVITTDSAALPLIVQQSARAGLLAGLAPQQGEGNPDWAGAFALAQRLDPGRIVILSTHAPTGAPDGASHIPLAAHENNAAPAPEFRFAPPTFAAADPMWHAAFAAYGAVPADAADVALLRGRDDPARGGLRLILPEGVRPGPHHITYWQDHHPLLRGIDWPALVLDTAAPFTPAADEITLLANDQGALMAAGPRHLRLGFDPAQSNMAETLPLLLAGRVLDWAGLSGARHCLIGQSCAMARALIGQVLTSADGQQMPVDAPWVIAKQAGVYGFEGRAVLQISPAPLVAPIAAELPVLRFPLDLTAWFLGLAALALVAEGWLARRAGAGRGLLIWRGAALGAVALSAAWPVLPLPRMAPSTAELTSSDPMALHLAAAAMPHGGALRLTTRALPDDLAQPLARLAASGVTVDIAAPEPPAGDVALTAAYLPQVIYAGDQVVARLGITAQRATQATLTLTAGEQQISTMVDVQLGANRVDLPLAMADTGAVDVVIELQAVGDPAPDNNRLVLPRDTLAAPRIAVVAQDDGPRDAVAGMLIDQGFDAIPLTPGRVPVNPDIWDRYDAALLLDLPAIALEMRQSELLASRVQDHGLGLVIAGGPHSFGPGGYLETPLETLSPLSARLPHEGPGIAMVFVLDRSGSMSQTVGDVTRLDVAKQAVSAAANLLDPQTGSLGVVMFGSEAEVALPLGPLPDAAGIAAALGHLQPGGGTNIYPGLQLAFQALRASDADARHIVVMTDGMSDEADFPGLLAAIRAEGITVSSVAIGSTSETSIAEDIALLGGGRFHNTRDFGALPSILAQEALMLRGAVIEEGQFPVMAEAAVPYTPGPISGLVRTRLKDEATPLLSAALPDGTALPLLARWHYGQGQVVALATAMTGRWSADWQQQGLTPLLLAQALRQVLPAPQPEGIRRAGDTAVVSLLAGQQVMLDGTALPQRAAAGGLVEVTVPLGPAPQGLMLHDGDGMRRLGLPGIIPTADMAQDYSAALAAEIAARPPTQARAATVDLVLRPWLIVLALALFLAEILRRYGYVLPRLTLHRKG